LKKLLSISFSVLFIVSCGGGGGGGSTPTTPTTPAPTVNLSAEPTSVLLESTSTLTWSSSNAASCSASWTSQTGTSGSEAVTITAVGSNSFSISCTGAGGNRSASVTVEGYRETDGVVVDGYISGAEVCIDEDDSWTCDLNESKTTSDNEGKFTIRYANGNLVSIGGTDLDSQTLLDNLLITHKLTGHSDFKAVTPVTSVAAFMEDASLVNAALGIDSSIDVFTFDPVANKGDGGINDYLYEKGNQLTVLAFALQNITNDLNTTTETTQDYFKAITEEIEKEYTETETKVDIETETFITNVIENIIETKSVTIDETAKANTTKALTGILSVIEVKSSDDLTTAVIRFAVSTLQTDIQAIANGTATAETVTSYTSDVLAYIAENQNIDADEIAPDISAIADSATTSEDTAVTINVVANDSYVTNAPVTVTTSNGTNGTTTIAESSQEQITYTPNEDFNGTDTFSYTIIQGDKTSSADVTVTIEAVNDEPSIDIALTIQVAENQTAVTTVSVSDVDEDELTLTLGGTDADSFNLSDENVLTFKEEPDYETKTSYSITLSLTDGTETVTKDVTIAITNVNDISPIISSKSTFSADENQKTIGSVTASDEDGDGITYAVSGSELTINPSSGALTFASAPDYETKTTYTATITVSDGVFSVKQDITININNLNDNSPVFTPVSTFSAVENQKAIGNVSATDADGDSITFIISGSELEITSAGVLTFVSAPDYETKNKYTATVTASDGMNPTTQNITVNITNDESDDPTQGNDTKCQSEECQKFSGKALDGYLVGAKVYIDQNFNFNWDEGEIIGTTDENGAFSIPVNDDSIYQCLASRPIVVDVPVGAVDTSRGEVKQAYKMALPSINDAGTDSIIISPFTNLLSNAITKAKSDSGIKEDLSVNDGCGSVADGIATKISSEVSQIIGAIEESLGVTYEDLLTDFVAAESNQYITTDAAENLADFFPYFKQVTDEIDQELTIKYDIPINTNLTIQRETISDILENSPSSIKMNFFAVYKEEPNSLGWYLEESVEARNGILNNDGTLIHAECLTSQENCSSDSFNLNAVKDASSWYMKRSDLQNSNYKLDDNNWSLNYEESMYISYEADGSVNERRCNDQNWLYIKPKVNAENRTRSDRYNTGFAYGGNAVDSCKTARETGIFDQGQETPHLTTNGIFMRLVDTYTNPDGSGTEDFEIGLTNSSFKNSKFLSKKLDKIFENRDSLDINPLIQEINSIPRTFAEIDDIRARIVPGSGDRVKIYYTERDAQSQMVRSFQLGVGDNRSQDTYTEIVHENSDLGNSFEEIANVTGINSQSLFRTALIEKSEGWSDEEHVGAVNTISGKAIDGYISGAEIFIDKNFNFKKDVDEYTAITDENGAFTIEVVGDSYACLVNRPIVANVPVGAVDSSLGEVTEAYQMILPSISDLGASTVVISPFSTIFSEAIIKAKEEANIKDELTSEEACGTEANQIASEISKRITEVKTSVESSYGVAYEDILSDFIESGSSGVISEATAQNIATYFRPIKELQDNISSSMTSALGLPIIANITFEREVIDSIFSSSTLTELPLDFYSVYTTETNDLGWRREVNFRANGAKVDQDGNINAFKCLENPASDCVSSELNIENLGNFSEDYRQAVGFYYGSGNGTQVSIGNATGVMVVDASDVKYFFESEDQDRFSCGIEEQIQLQGDSSDDVYWEYKYQTNYDESNSATNGCGDNDIDSSARRGSIEILRKDSTTQTSIGTSYVMPDMDNTTLFSSTPKKLIENFETVDPKGILEEIATFPTDYYELESARERLSNKEELQYTYSERYSNSNFKTQYQLKIYADSHPDSAADSLTVTNYGEDGSISSSASYTGTSALETFDNFVSSKSDEMSALFYAQGNVISGEVMDGYISGADVFIDQNFNFIKDSGEISAKTFSDGSFKLRVLDDNQYSCLINRPIVANVPVGAVDSTLGTVTKAYQMILPSISDSGVSAIVISPFTSILSETILSAKENSDDFVEDLTLEEGCGEKGNQLATSISSELQSLESSIKTGFGINATNLYTDFIELESSGLISEQSAQNIATIFPYIKQVNDEISDYLTKKYNKTIRANVALGQESLDIIFSGESFDKLPLSFTSIYETNPNSEGWYQREEITASRGYISNTGVLSREDCSESDTVLCNVTEITLDNIANTATSYHRQSNFLNDNLTIDGIAEGSIAVYAWDSRDWRNGEDRYDTSLWQEPDNRSRECRGTNDVQFQVSSPETLSNYHYSSYSQGYGQADCASYKRYYYPTLNISTIYDREVDDNSIQANYYIPDVVRTGVTSNLPFDFIKNQVSINPSELIQDLDDLPRFPKDIDEIRRKLVGDDYVLFEYHHDPHISYFEFGTFPRNDTFIKDGDFNNKLYGQLARDAWFAELQTEPTFDSGVYGLQPTGSKALGYLSKSWMQITDYYGSENTAVGYDIYPTYDAQTKTLDLSLKGAELDLENIREFIENGINGKPIDAKIYINPDNAVTGTMPLKLSLYHGADDVAGEGEDYFTIEFDIQVNSSASGLEMSISAQQEITAKYISGSVIIEKVITNGDEDKIVITDNENGLQRPSSITNKVFTLLQEVAEEINGIKNFFSDGGEYYFKVDMGGGDKFSIVDYYFNTVDYMVGTFKTASSPASGIFVRDIPRVFEGNSEQICFTRSAGTNSLTETTFNISFSEIDRPGRGGDTNDFTLSSDIITFANGETESCITITAESDRHFDWITELRFNLTEPSSGEGLARNQFLVRIYNDNSATNTLNGIPGNPGESMPISGSD